MSKRPDVAARNAASPTEAGGAPADWVGSIDKLSARLRAWLSSARAARIGDAELSQIASAARRLASLAEDVLEQRAYAASEAEDTEMEGEAGKGRIALPAEIVSGLPGA